MQAWTAWFAYVYCWSLLQSVQVANSQLSACVRAPENNKDFEVHLSDSTKVITRLCNAELKPFKNTWLNWISCLLVLNSNNM